MEFYTQYSRRPSPISNPGDEKYPNYKMITDKNGHSEVVPDGTFNNIQDKINSFYESTEINNIMARFQQGDVSVLNKVKGVYGDFTDMPETYAELYQRMSDANNFFKQLDPEIKEMFNNNAVEFFQSMGSKDFVEKLEYFDKKHNVYDEANKIEVKEKANG